VKRSRALWKNAIIAPSVLINGRAFLSDLLPGPPTSLTGACGGSTPLVMAVAAVIVWVSVTASIPPVDYQPSLSYGSVLMVDIQGCCKVLYVMHRRHWAEQESEPQEVGHAEAKEGQEGGGVGAVTEAGGLPLLVPELCEVHPLPGSMWAAAEGLLGAVMHRVQGLLAAQDAVRHLCHPWYGVPLLPLPLRACCILGRCSNQHASVTASLGAGSHVGCFAAILGTSMLRNAALCSVP
jgi:hypothetical protein